MNRRGEKYEKKSRSIRVQIGIEEIVLMNTLRSIEGRVRVIAELAYYL